MELKIDNSTMESLVRTEVQTRVAEVLARNSQTLIKEVVRKAFEEKKEDRYGYGNRTIIENTLNTMIREQADEAIKEWIESVKPEIKKMMTDRLRDKKLGLAAKVADQMTAALSGQIQLRVFLERNE